MSEPMDDACRICAERFIDWPQGKARDLFVMELASVLEQTAQQWIQQHERSAFCAYVGLTRRGAK